MNEIRWSSIIIMYYKVTKNTMIQYSVFFILAKGFKYKPLN